jgi:hypothetical protein
MFAAALGLSADPAPAQDDEDVLVRAGKFLVEERGYVTRLVYDGTLFGTQFHERYLVRADAPALFGLLTPWEVLAQTGGLARWDPRHEPLTYYHRTGPVGAVFHHLRTRKTGADAAAPVGVVGLFAGTPAAYALPGQRMTFYSAHPELRDLIETTDRYFTFVPDARKRGARLEFRYGPVRKALAADADRRFALLLVEMVEEGYDPGDRLTLEAVRLYLDRVTPDGIVALHTSNKRFDLEPVIERIARELKLVSRVWDDDSESRPGKTASSWVVLSRTSAALGVFARPLVNQAIAYGTKNRPLADVLEKYRPHRPAREVFAEEWGLPTSGPGSVPYREVSIRLGPQVGNLYFYAEWARERGDDITPARMAEWAFGKMFRPLVADPRVELRTDDHRPGLPTQQPAKK